MITQWHRGAALYIMQQGHVKSWCYQPQEQGLRLQQGLERRLSMHRYNDWHLLNKRWKRVEAGPLGGWWQVWFEHVKFWWNSRSCSDMNLAVCKFFKILTIRSHKHLGPMKIAVFECRRLKSTSGPQPYQPFKAEITNFFIFNRFFATWNLTRLQSFHILLYFTLI